MASEEGEGVGAVAGWRREGGRGREGGGGNEGEGERGGWRREEGRGRERLIIIDNFNSYKVSSSAAVHNSLIYMYNEKLMKT